MRRKLLLALIAIITTSTSLPAFAVTDPVSSERDVYMLALLDDAGNEVLVTGTREQIDAQIVKYQEEAISLAASVSLGDDCRVKACFKTVVDASTGITQTLALTEEEILQREVDTARRAIRAQALVNSAGSNYQVRSEAIYAIPINAAGISQTIQGTPAQIADQIVQLRAQADSLKNGVDPCSIETCYKTIVDLHWGLAPATTTTIPLSVEDLAQRAIDRQQQASRAEAVAAAAESSSASPVYQLSVETANRGFGTSGTRDQLAAAVAQLREQAAQAAANANNLASNPIVERSLIVDLHWGLAPATETIIEREITGTERDQRIADANSQAAQAEALAAAAEQALAQIP